MTVLLVHPTDHLHCQMIKSRLVVAIRLLHDQQQQLMRKGMAIIDLAATMVEVLLGTRMVSDQ